MKENVVEKESKKNETKQMGKHHILKVTLILCSILIILVIAGSYIYIMNLRKQIAQISEKALKQVERTIEYGTKMSHESISEILVDSRILAGTDINIQIIVDGKVVNHTESYEFNNVGEVPIIVKAIYSDIPFNIQGLVIVQKENIWKVEDTKKPVLTGVHDSEITQGDNFDIKSGISAKDEVDGDLSFTVDGNFDANKPGEYTLTVKAVDKNNNETSQTFKVKVKEKEVNKVNNNTSSNKTTSSNSSNNKNTSTSNKKSTSSSNSGTSSNKTNSNTNKGSGSSSNGSSTSTKAGREALAKAEAKKVVAKIIKSGMTKLEKAQAICNYITDTVEVQYNQSSEAYKTNYGNEAYAALVMKIAACSGRCKAVTLLCNAAGLKSQHINKDLWTHQWNKVQIDDGSWVVVDAQIGFVGEKHPLE